MKVKRYANKLYEQNQEMQAFFAALGSELEQLNEKTQEVFYDNFAVTAKLPGIRQYEKLLSIKADPQTEDLAFRRERVINWLALRYPFTEYYLRDWLNSRFGEENVEFISVSQLYTVYIYLKTTVPKLYEQTLWDLQEIIPANLLLYTRQITPLQTEERPLTKFAQAFQFAWQESKARARKQVGQHTSANLTSKSGLVALIIHPEIVPVGRGEL